MKSNLTNFRNFKECAEYAPEGTYEAAAQLNEIIGDLVDELIRKLRKEGLKADNCDRAYELESYIYAYVKACNGDNPMFPVSEGFGDALNDSSELRERVIANAERDRDAFNRILATSK